MINGIDILAQIKNILDKQFDNVCLAFLEDAIFNSPILNGVYIEPAGEEYESVGLGDFTEKELESVSFNINLVRLEEFDGDTFSLKQFIDDKDKIIEALYCDELLGLKGNFRSFKIETEPLKFEDDETMYKLWLYKIKVYGKIRR